MRVSRRKFLGEVVGSIAAVSALSRLAATPEPVTAAASTKFSTMSTLLFRDPAQPLAARIDDLISRLTLPEKINQLGNENSAIERLGIPPYNWWNEACHGVGRNGRATVFPQSIGLAATWNVPLLERIATAISDEARAKHHAALAKGRHGQYQGLTFWTPNINILRDPRWGRGQETFGEDPFLTGELGVAMVRGLQGNDVRYLKAAACAKHFAVHSGPESERHTCDVHPTPKDLAETYLPAFERLVRAGVEAVMGAYNRVDGEPCCASPRLLGETLRGRWGFKGHVVSDCGALDDIHRHQKLTHDAAESAARALRAGCDLNCGCTYNDLLVAVRAGQVTEAEVDRALRRLLATKFRLGFFDPVERVPFHNIPASVIDCAAHHDLARQAAVESIVLLKNADDVLPLRTEPRNVFVVGPNAAATSTLLGNYYGVSGSLVTFVEGIAQRLPEGTAMEYRLGCALLQGGDAPDNYAFVVAEAADVVVAIMGLDPSIEGEEGDAAVSAAGGDRLAIELPRNQRGFLRELRRHSKKLILVVTGGNAIALTEEHEFCDAILQVWYPGCEGGRALADVLFGDAAPSGKLPVTVPRRTEDLPAFGDYHMRGRTYRFAAHEPLYPFGFGLTYARFAYGPLQLSTTTMSATGEVVVRTTVANSSDRAAVETVQCYVIPPRDWPDAPRATLVGFQKLAIPARGEVAVEFRLPAEKFAQVDAAGQRVHAPGVFEIVVGAAVPGERAQALGAPAPARGQLRLVG